MDSQTNLMNCSLKDNLTFNTGTASAAGQVLSAQIQANNKELKESLATASSNLVYNSGTNMSAWEYWQNIYYPTTISTSYPVYIRDRAEDKGKQAFEIIKMLQDKRFMDLKTVRDFIDAMDLLIKTL